MLTAAVRSQRVHGVSTETPEEELKVVMTQIDTVGNRVIDLNKFTEFQRRGCSSSDGDAVKSLGEKCLLNDCCKMIESVDVDGGGCVNFEEFKKMTSK
ncbi:putative EF-hand domain pair protein CML [Helianthus anomalus]